MSAQKLAEQLDDALIQLAYYKGLVGAFYEGVAPIEGASLQHHIFAKYGRKRLEDLQQTPALLRSDNS